MIRSIIVIIILGLTSCIGNSQQLKTPKEYLNHTTADAFTYSKDSTMIIAELYKKMKNHEASFANPEYFDSTVLIIDTIMYDSSLNKIAVFVVARNPTYRNSHSNSKLPYYYNANCYVGKRLIKDSSIFELKCLCKFSEINFDDRLTIVRALKEDFFLELATTLNENRQPVFGYNLDDKRFWDNTTGWKRMFE